MHFFLSELGDFFLGSTGLLLGLLRFHDALKLLDVRDVCCLVFVALEFFFGRMVIRLEIIESPTFGMRGFRFK